MYLQLGNNNSLATRIYTIIARIIQTISNRWQ